MIKEDPFFWYTYNTITIPGVHGEHTILHVTDTHVNLWDEESTEEERAAAEKQDDVWKTFKARFANANGEPYGDPQDIPTKDAFEKQMALAKELNPEVLLLAGDNLEVSNAAGERFLTKKLEEYGGKYMMVPGNHEDQTFGNFWGQGVRVMEFEDFRIVAIDDSRMTVAKEDVDALRALCDEKKPIIILCHVPMSTPNCKDDCKEKMSGKNDYFYLDSQTEDEGGRAFVELCMNNETIKAVICGHVHGYYKMELVPGKPQIIGSMGMAGAVDIITVKG